MAQEDSKKSSRRPANAFIAKVVSDPAKPPNLMRLVGYVGASPEAGSVRLYANSELTGYWDIPEADIVHELAVPEESDPLGSVMVWIKADSKVTYNTPQAAAQAANVAEPIRFSPLQVQCTIPHSLFACPPSPYLCPSVLPLLCHTNPIICNVVSPTCPTVGQTFTPQTTIETFAQGFLVSA